MLSIVLFTAFTSASAAFTTTLTKTWYSRPATIPATNQGFSAYTLSVGIGNPPTRYDLILDTGSSNTFCGTGRPYVRTPTSIPTGKSVNVTYGSGNFSGLEYLDQVSLAANLIITNQSIGDAISSNGFGGVDGILGVGPADLTLGTLPAEENTVIPTVMNNLFSQGVIKEQILSVYFQPPTSYNDTNGALTFGGVDPSLYTGEVTYAPVTDTFPANQFWGLNATSSIGNYTIIPTSTAGIVDTGTTLVLLADDFFDTYMSTIPGAKFNESLSMIEIPASSIPYMKPLEFHIANRVFTMTTAAQLFPESENAALGGDAGKQYGTVGQFGRASGKGLDFVLGQKFLERYYVVFDADAHRIGFAETNNTWSPIEG